MQIAIWTLLGIGLIVLIVTTIWILVYAFKSSIWWGLACFLIPFVIYIYCFLNWDRCKKPFLIGFFAFVLMIVAVALSPNVVDFDGIDSSNLPTYQEPSS